MTRRAYMNNTGENVIYKVWAVPLNAVKSNHFPMLKSHNIPARCVMDHESFTAVNGGNYRYGVDGQAEFDTSNSEQEVVLKLLYGSTLILKISTVVVSHSTCTVVS